MNRIGRPPSKIASRARRAVIPDPEHALTGAVGFAETVPARGSPTTTSLAIGRGRRCRRSYGLDGRRWRHRRRRARRRGSWTRRPRRSSRVAKGASARARTRRSGARTNRCRPVTSPQEQCLQLAEAPRLRRRLGSHSIRGNCCRRFRERRRTFPRVPPDLAPNLRPKCRARRRAPIDGTGRRAAKF